MNDWEDVAILPKNDGWEDVLSGGIDKPLGNFDMDMSQLNRTIGTPEDIAQGVKVEPKEGLETPVVSPEMLVGFSLQGTKAVGGEVIGSILSDIGVEGVNDIMSDEFKKEYPTLATIMQIGGGIVGGVVGSKIEGIHYDPSVLMPDKQKSIREQLNEATKANIDSISADDKAIILNAIQEAENAGIKLFGSDIKEGDTISQLQQSMMKNPITASAIKNTTDEQKSAMLKYIDKIKTNISEDFSSQEDVMRLTKEKLELKNSFKDKEISKAYDSVRAISQNVNPVGVGIYKGKLSDIKRNILDGSYSADPDVVAKLESFINRKIKQLDKSGNQGTFDDVYSFMRATIQKASEEKSGLMKKGYAKLAGDMEILFDDMVKASGVQDEVYDALNQAKELYRQRVDMFGYRDTGKGTSSFIPKFLDAIENTPDKAIDMIKKSDDWNRLKDNLDENTLGLIRRAKLESIISSSRKSGVEDLLMLSKNVMKENKNLMRDIFGKDGYNTIVGVAKASEYIGKRLDTLSKPNLLGLEGLRKQMSDIRGVMPKVSLFSRVIQEKLQSRLLNKADRKKLENIQKELNMSIKSSGLTLDELLNNIKTLDDEMKYDIKINENEVFKAPIVNATKNEDLAKEISNTFGIKGSKTPTYPKQGSEVGGLDRLYGTKVNKPMVQDNSLSAKLGGQSTQGEVGGLTNIPETTKMPIQDKQLTPTGSNLGLGIHYGGKPTNTGGVNTKEAKSQLKSFLDEIANPSVTVNQDKVTDIFNKLSKDSKLAYSFSDKKKEVYNKLMEELNLARQQSSIKGKNKKAIEDLMRQYMDMID